MLSLNRAATHSGGSPQKQPPPSLNQAALRWESYPRKQPLLSVYRAAPRSRSSTDKQPSSLPLSSSPTQRRIPQNQPPPSLNQAAPRWEQSSPRKQPLLSLSQSSSPEQRELSQEQLICSPSIEQPLTAGVPPRSSLPPLTIKQPCAGRATPGSSLFSPSIEQPRAAGAPPRSNHLLSLYRAAPCSGGSPRISLLPLLIKQPHSGGGLPGSSLFSPSIKQRRAVCGSSICQQKSSLSSPLIKQPRAGSRAPPEAASSLAQSSSPGQLELSQKQPSSLSLSIEQPRAAGAPPIFSPNIEESGSPTSLRFVDRALSISLTATMPFLSSVTGGTMPCAALPARIPRDSVGGRPTLVAGVISATSAPLRTTYPSCSCPRMMRPQTWLCMLHGCT